MKGNRAASRCLAAMCALLALAPVPPVGASGVPAPVAVVGAACAQDGASFTPGELAALEGFRLGVLDETGTQADPSMLEGWDPGRLGYTTARPGLVVALPRGGVEGLGVAVRWYDARGAYVPPSGSDPDAWLDSVARTVVTVTGLTSKATRAYTVAADASLLPAEPPAGTCAVAVWRLYNPGLAQVAQHLYTSNVDEYNRLQQSEGWKGEGIVFYTTSDKTAKTVWRVYNPFTSEHFLTSDQAEYEDLYQNKGWSDDGPAWYIPADGDADVYRLRNAATGEHLYTVNAAEKDNLVDNAGWVLEGVQYKVYAK